MKNNDNTHIVQEGTFSSSEGGEHVYFKHYLPAHPTSGKDLIHIIFQHGAIEYHARYEEFFEYLKKHFSNRLIISCMDFVGLGLSGGTRSHISDFDHYVKDFCTFTHISAKLLPEHPKTSFFIAHSMGGLVVLESLIEADKGLGIRPRAAIFSNPCVRPKLEPPKKLVSFVQKYSDFFSKIRLPNINSSLDITSDKEKALSFDCDHLNCSFVTVKLGMELLAHSKKMTNLSYYLRTPSFFLLSGDDRIVDVETTKLFLSGVGKEFVSSKYFPEARHDLLNEVVRKKVYKDITTYIEKYL